MGAWSFPPCLQVGLAVVRCHEPLHYYSIFSHTHGADVVLTLYDGNRCERTLPALDRQGQLARPRAGRAVAASRVDRHAQRHLG